MARKGKLIQPIKSCTTPYHTTTTITTTRADRVGKKSALPEETDLHPAASPPSSRSGSYSTMFTNFLLLPYLLLLSSPSLVFAQQNVLTNGNSQLPACAQNCPLLQQANTACASTGTPQAAWTCFCQSAYLTNLYNTAVGICDSVCTDATQNAQVSTWYKSNCGTDNGVKEQAGDTQIAAATTAAAATTTATTNNAAAAAATPTPTSGSGSGSTSSASSSSSSSSSGESWWSGHYVSPPQSPILPTPLT